jgi:spectinomycin phosphotransferase
MKEKQLPSKKNISDWIRVNYNIEVTSITSLSKGADINAAIYKVQDHDQSSYFVKLNQGYKNDINIKLLELLHSKGIQQIIPPIRTIHDNFIVCINNFCLTIYPFIEGVDGFSRKLTDKQWTDLGNALRQVHDCDIPSSLTKHIKQETYSSKLRQTVRSFCDHIQQEPISNDVISLKFLSFFKKHRSVIQNLVDRAEQLSSQIKKQTTKFVLCHSDIHRGNVLIKRY